MHSITIKRTLGLGAIAALGFTALSVPANAADPTQDALRDMADRNETVATSPNAPKAMTDPIARAAGKDAASVGGRALSNEPGYWVFDTVVDGYDSPIYPELIGAGLTISKDRSNDLMILGITSSSTYGTDGYGVLMDTNSDGDSDFGAVTPDYMSLGTVYQTPLFRFDAAGNAVATGRWVQSVRTSDGYGINVSNWRSAGLTNVSYVASLTDGYDYDFAPDTFGRAIPTGAMVPSGTVKPPAQAAPAAVSGLKVKSKKSKAYVRWGSVKGAKSYKVMVKGSSSHRTWKSTSGTSITVKGLKKSKKYTVQVKANNGSKDGPVVTKAFRTKKK